MVACSRWMGCAGFGTPNRSCGPTATRASAFTRFRATGVGSRNRRVNSADHRSVGTPRRYLGRIHALRRVERWTCPATRARSTAMSQPELPMPTTTTLLPLNGSGVR
jgi:hypothetical protein